MVVGYTLPPGTLRLPDLRGMYAEASGFDSLGAGGVHGDGMREITGALADVYGSYVRNSYGAISAGASRPAGIAGEMLQDIAWDVYFLASRVVPTASVNRPRAWGALACVYLGPQAS